MQTITKLISNLWNRGRTGKIIVGVGGLIIFCCVCSGLSSLVPSKATPTPTALPPATATQSVRVIAVPTRTLAPSVTEVIATDTAVPTLAPSPTAIPATDTATPQLASTVPPTDMPAPTAAPTLVPATSTPVPAPTEAPVATAVPATVQPTTAPVAQAPCNCNGPDLNCPNFTTHAAAQACWEYCGGKAGGPDPFKLDGNGDGVACQNLP
jgi:hypothetical protein